MTTAGYLVAALAVGISLTDLDALSIGAVLDIFMAKTDEGYTEVDAAGAEDFFAGR